MVPRSSHPLETPCNFRGYRISGTFRLNPTHWKLPVIPDQDKTVVAATDLLEQHKKFTPPSTIHKRKHIAINKQLQSILSNNPRQRVDKAQEPRVDNTPPQRVNTATPQRVDTCMTSSDSPTDTRVLRMTPRIHQRHTRRNTQMPDIMEVAEPHPEQGTRHGIFSTCNVSCNTLGFFQRVTCLHVGLHVTRYTLHDISIPPTGNYL